MVQGIGDDSCFVIISLLMHIHLPSFLPFSSIFSLSPTYLPYLLSFPFLPFFFLSPSFLSLQECVWYFKDDPASVTEDDVSLLFLIFTFSEEYRLAHHLYTVVSVLGHGGFSQVTLVAVNGICSAKVLCKPSLFQKSEFL